MRNVDHMWKFDSSTNFIHEHRWPSVKTIPIPIPLDKASPHTTTAIGCYPCPPYS